MGLEVESEIFKWLQSINIVKDGKRTQNAIELSQQATSKLFDGLYISRILKLLLKQKKQDQAINRLQSIKQNSTPAIRLYNWNIICQALKKVDYTMDYSQKSKLLSIQPEPLIKLLNYLYGLRSNVEKIDGTKFLQVETSNIGKRTLKQALNIFQFLVISISKHFKLLVQHTLNLFLDSNKYLSHLLVKGVKNQFQPVYLLLQDILQHINFIVDTLFCVEENQNIFFFFNAIKPCLISKEKEIASQCLTIIKEIYENYTKKSVEITSAINWMEKQGINTIFFSINRHPELFQQALAISYAFLDQKLFTHLQPHDKSLLWNNQIEKMKFFHHLIMTSHPQLINKFIQSTVFDEWNRYCLKLLKKSKNNQQICMLITIYEHIWMKNGQFFEKNENGMPNIYIIFLKNCTLAQSEMVFIEGCRTLFHLLYKLGNSKNTFAPLIYKTIISSLGNQTELDRIQFIFLNFIEAFKQITTLPAMPLTQPLIRHMQSSPSATQIELCRLMLSDPKLRQQTAQDIMQTLAKIFFQNIQLGILAIETKISHLKKKQDDEILNNYCKATLGHFVSLGRQITRSALQLKNDFNRYKNEESMRRGEANFLKNTTKYLVLSNLVIFVQKCLFLSETFKADAQSMIFHTYIKVKKEIKKENIHKMLLPLLFNYTDEEQLQSKINQFQIQILDEPKKSHAMLVSNVQHDEASQIVDSPLASPKEYKLEKQSSIQTQENSPSLSMKRSHLESIQKQFSLIKQKREQQRQKNEQLIKEKDVIKKKKQLFMSVVNEKRLVQFGSKIISDGDYKNLLEFDSVKVEGNLVGLPNIKLLNLQDEEERQYIDDMDMLMKKYRKVWRFLFYQHATVDTVKSNKETGQQKINVSQIWKMTKDYQFDQIKKQQSLMIVKKINESMKRKNDLQNLTFQGFQEFIIQMCHYAYGKAGFTHIPPSQQILKFIEQIRSVTASKGGSTIIFDSPEQVYFQETQVISQFNRRLRQNQQYVLPEGYKKIKRDQLVYSYTIKPEFKKIKNSYKQVFEVLSQILFNSFKINIMQPRTQRVQRYLARPALFQNIKQKLKDYTGGYLKPKASVNLTSITKQVSPPIKIEFHPMINFSIGIKLGLAGVNVRYRTIAEEVAYWLDDALDAVQAGKLKVVNKSKIRIENEIIRRKRSAAYQMKLQKLDHQKRQRIRAETVKHETQKYVEQRQEDEAKKRQKQRQFRLQRKAKQQRQLKRKMQQFQQAKNKLQAKRKQIQQQKQVQIQTKKKQKVEYRKNVQEYFKKKKEQLQQTQKKMKAHRQGEQKQKIDRKNRQIEKKKRLQIEIFKKEEEVLQKIVGSKMSYEQVYKSPQIQAQLLIHRPRIKLIFDLLLKYQKSKISSTKQNQLGINTLNFFCIKTNIIPFLLPKNALTFIYKNTIKELNGSRNGFSFNQFEEFIFKIVAKGKDQINNKATDDYEEDEQQMPAQNSSPNQKKKRILTDQYALDAAGVTPTTIKRLMQFLRMPFDKKEAQERFRQMLQYKNKLPSTIALKEAKNLLDSTIS